MAYPFSRYVIEMASARPCRMWWNAQTGNIPNSTIQCCILCISSGQPQLQVYGLLLVSTFARHRRTVVEGPEKQMQLAKTFCGHSRTRRECEHRPNCYCCSTQKAALACPTLRSTTAALASRWRMHAIRDLCQCLVSLLGWC